MEIALWPEGTNLMTDSYFTKRQVLILLKANYIIYKKLLFWTCFPTIIDSWSGYTLYIKKTWTQSFCVPYVSTRGWFQVVDEPPLFFVNTIIVVRRRCYDIVATSSRIYTPVPCSSMCWFSGRAFIVSGACSATYRCRIIVYMEANSYISTCKYYFL
jgi:hypothetical protein